MNNRISLQRSTLTLPQISLTTPFSFDARGKRFKRFSVDLEEALLELESSYDGPETFQRFDWLKSEAEPVQPMSLDLEGFDFDARWM